MARITKAWSQTPKTEQFTKAQAQNDAVLRIVRTTLKGIWPAGYPQTFCSKNMNDDTLKVNPPLFMVGLKIHCWRCDAKMSVISLLAPNVEDTEDQVCLLTGIENLPKEVLSFIQIRVPTFKLKFSKTANTKYFANTCPKCGVLFGDFFLNDEPGAPFFPEDE